MAVVQSEGELLSATRPWSPRSNVGAISFPSGAIGDYASIYRTQPNVRLVVHFLARNIAQLQLRAGRRVDDSRVEPLDRKHPLNVALRRPNPRTTRHRFVLALMHDLAIFDAFYVPKMRNPASNALRLHRIPPQTMRPKNDGSWLYPEAFELVLSGGIREFPADQVIYCHGHDPEDPRSGLSPIESIRRILIEETAAAEYRAQMWQRGNRHSGVITRPLEAPTWSPTARNRFREEVRENAAGSGPDAGGTLILEEGMEWVDASFSAKDSQYLEARVLARGEVAAQYHVSPLFVGILEHANFSNVSEQHRHLYSDTLGPWCDMIEEDLELQLVPEFSDLDPDEIEIRFDLEEKLRGSFLEEATLLQTATGAPWMARNEARARRGLAPIAGGDELVVPLNVLVGGQASPRDTAPPATASRGRRRGHANRVPGPTSKALGDLPADVAGWHAKHLEVIVPFFERQGAAVRSRLGAGQPIETAFDSTRWDGELHTDLSALALSMAEDVAGATADEWGGTYDPALAEAWLLENARIAAEKVNATTVGALTDRLDNLEDDDDPLDVVDAVFATATTSRADEIALTRTTSIGNFARKEGAEQSGVGSKVWNVNSANSRHADMDGETVPIGDTFSNGLLWPGDSSGSADDTAGCVCSLSFEP